MLTYYSEFAGVGGDTAGAAQVPGLKPVLAANHESVAVESHSANFPDVEHILADITAIDVTKLPRVDIFWASPSCPAWTDARGRRRDFDRSTQPPLFGPDGPDEQTARSRALMEEVPRYLRAVAERGTPVLAGVVENVIQCRKWDQWHRWLDEIRKIGYRVRVIALNSMHVMPRRTRWAPQSRDRLYVAYWHTSLNRDPDWDKWLRPFATCPRCDTQVAAMQVFKDPTVDMGRYGHRNQYLYRCPDRRCRNGVVEPDTLPAAAVIDWSVPGERLRDRKKPLAPNTLARIGAGLRRHGRAFSLEVAGNTFERRPGVRTWPLDAPLTTQTTTATKALAVPARAWPEGPSGPTNAMVMRNNTPRGNPAQMCTPVDTPLRTLTTAGHQSLVTWVDMLVPYYGNGTARTTHDPAGTFTTKDRYALVGGNPHDVDLDEVRYRMLLLREIGAGMAFPSDYIVLGTHKQQVRQFGNAVTPPVAEIFGCAFVETIDNVEISRHETASRDDIEHRSRTGGKR